MKHECELMQQYQLDGEQYTHFKCPECGYEILLTPHGYDKINQGDQDAQHTGGAGIEITGLEVK